MLIFIFTVQAVKYLTQNETYILYVNILQNKI